MALQNFGKWLKKAQYSGLAILVASSFVLWPASTATALPGAGTSVSPYQIASCADWMDIWDDLSANYVLMNDIDCSANGGNIVIGDAVLAFSGNLNGGNHRITVDIDDATDPDDVAGLFNYLGGTVRDLDIAGSIKTTLSAGGLAAFAEYSSIDDVNVSADVQGGNNTGGMIGEISSSVVITNSSVTGDVTGGNNTGGFVGSATVVSVTDSIYNGTITGNNNVGGMYGNATNSSLTRTGANAIITGQNTVGGLVGSMNGALPISESYADGSVTANADSAGGLLGFININGVVENSYSLSDVSAANRAAGIAASALTNTVFTNVYAAGLVTSAGSRGGLVALTTFNQCVDSFWDARGGANTSFTDCSMAGATSRQSTAQMKNYFLYVEQPNRAAAWDFDTIWGINSTENDGYPFLQWQGYTSNHERDQDPIAAAIEDAGPNGGDADGSGAPDADESDVASLPSAGDPNKYVAVRSNASSCKFTSVGVANESDLAKADVGFQYPNGFVNFTADCGTPGAMIDVKIFFYGVESTDPVIRHFNPNTQTYSTLDDAPIPLIIGGQKAYMLAYPLQDGGPLDGDGVANGIIVDPIGVGQRIATTNPVGSGSAATLANTGNSPLLPAGAAVTIMIVSVLVTRVIRPRSSSF